MSAAVEDGVAAGTAVAVGVAVQFDTAPERYRHWALAVDGAVATLTLRVDPDGGRPAYPDSPDATVYAWSGSPAARGLSGALAATLHDHSVTETLDDVTADVDPHRVVGVMGGHAQRRDERAYAAAARRSTA